MAAVDAFLSEREWAASTRRIYAHQLAGAGRDLGFPALPSLCATELVLFRLSLSRGRTGNPPVLSTLQSFLLWTRERRKHRLPPEVIRTALKQRRPDRSSAL